MEDKIVGKKIKDIKFVNEDNDKIVIHLEEGSIEIRSTDYETSVGAEYYDGEREKLERELKKLDNRRREIKEELGKFVLE